MDPDAIKVDLARVSLGAEELRQCAERTRAHRTHEAKFDPAATTFGALHQALDGVREVIRKYYARITLGIIDRWEAVGHLEREHHEGRVDLDAVLSGVDSRPPASTLGDAGGVSESQLRDISRGVFMVEGKGVEPSTSALRTPRSPN